MKQFKNLLKMCLFLIYSFLLAIFYDTISFICILLILIQTPLCAFKPMFCFTLILL